MFSILFSLYAHHLFLTNPFDFLVSYACFCFWLSLMAEIFIFFLLYILPDRIPGLEADRGRHLLLPCPQRERLGDVRLMAAGSAATPADGDNVNYKIRGRGQTG
jgi:hypothetical protein